MYINTAPDTLEADVNMQVMKMDSIQAVIAMLMISSVSAQIVNEDNPYCKSVFDFYFVLDRQVLLIAIELN